jgi:predicted small lipoprotein YifL
MKRLVLALALLVAVAACGKKGGLERPPEWDAKPAPADSRTNQRM